jgi:hypothetical protein
MNWKIWVSKSEPNPQHLYSFQVLDSAILSGFIPRAKGTIITADSNHVCLFASCQLVIDRFTRARELVIHPNGTINP